MATQSRSSSSRTVVASVLVALFAPIALVVACSNDNANPQPAPPVYQVEDSGPSTAPSADSGQDAAASSDDASPPNADAQPTQLDGAPVQDAASCTAEAGCWSCTPLTPPEFLNQCTGSQCSPFVNAQRLPNYDGGLPPLN
jgi:hypothetical protein